MGRAAALRLVEEGGQVAFVGRRPDPISQLQSEIEGRRRQSHCDCLRYRRQRGGCQWPSRQR
ncbi:hypothetical protein ACOJBM_35395 [Rhizobium beringeri]